MRDDLSDRDLVEAANRGDARAFAALYERHRDWVVALAWRLTGDRDLALDAMQQVFTEFLGPRRYCGPRSTTT